MANASVMVANWREVRAAAGSSPNASICRDTCVGSGGGVSGDGSRGDWLVGRLVGWLVGWLFGWLVG